MEATQKTLLAPPDKGSHERKFTQRGTLMETLQQVMYAFYAVLMLAAAGIGVWFYKKRKENDR